MWAGLHLGDLGLQVTVFHLQVTLLSEGSGQGGILGIEQSLQVLEPLQRPRQVGLLFAIPAKNSREWKLKEMAGKTLWLAL